METTASNGHPAPELPARVPTPTASQFHAYEGMYAYFNRALFGGELPACLLNFSRRGGTYGFFAPKRWGHSSGDVRHEISINPTTLATRPAIEVAGTLVHEMVHLWQQEHGKPSRTGYHNAEWAAKMIEVGLLPTDDGTPQGKKTGQSVSHLIVDGGPFAVAFRQMPADLLLPWSCAPEPEDGKKKKSPKNKVKYSCAGGCGVNVWGKPGLALKCDDCDEPFEAEEG